MKNYKKTLTACYLGFITQAISANFVPLLFLTFHRSYSIPLSKIALISTCFFFTQLVVDLFCAKFVDRIGYRVSIIISEITSGLGLAGLALLPDLFVNPYAGIITCTIIYAVGSGLIEVLVSPIVEACPFENKAGTMSLLHSFYCWGSVGVILLSTVFFHFAGLDRWRILACLWALVPLYNILNFATCPIEHLVEDGKGMTINQLFKNKLFWLFCLLMVCAGSSEIAMAQWASAFVESALHVSKTVGDLAGPCCFAILMGISRVFYGKYGEKYDLKKFMVISGMLCLACYLIAAFAKIPLMGLLGCALCGFSVGIMWPGTISIASKSLPLGGTAIFAFFALAGDLGGSLGPAIIGFVSQRNGENLQSGIFAGIGFPLILVLCVTFLLLKEKTETKNKKPE
ncbi:MFS transporter [Treponema sp.]|uniref:MFS transporter n=1 Tax=Treponema sp. TaxID=166 RepID=UPI00388D0708